MPNELKPCPDVMKKWKSDMLVENILCFQQTEVAGFAMALMKCIQVKNKKLKPGTGGLTMPEYIEREALIKDINETVVFTVRKGVQLPTAEMRGANKVIDQIKSAPTADVIKIPDNGIGELSDGYHTFNELYHHRAILFSVICNSNPSRAWKSRLHDTGDMFDGMFIVGIETPQGQATYHYDIEPYWDLFKVKELEKAPKWDEHTPQQAIDRISSLSADMVEVRRGEWKMRGGVPRCSECDEKALEKDEGGTGGFSHEYVRVKSNYCPNCGAKMDGKGD